MMIRACLQWLCAGLAVLLILLNLLPFSTSDEWLYTLKWLNAICGGIIAVCLLILIWSPGRILCLGCAALLIAITFIAPGAANLGWQWQYALSACWAGAFIFSGIALFSLGSDTSGLKSWLCCGLGSIAFAIAAVELFYLATPQGADGIENLSAKSKYQGPGGQPENESWRQFQCGRILNPGPGKTQVFHRVAKFGQDLFDAVYNFNDSGFRITPKAHPDAINNLMLFGCSMTFGHGLNEEQTWAWQLAKNLGPAWQLENYAMSSWSANQMLCLLEHNLVPRPREPRRYALFLAIDDHLRRNDFFGATPHYEFSPEGEIRAGGKHRFDKIHNLPDRFNGSQSARETSAWLLRTIMRKPESMLKLYLALLKRSAQLLRDNYDTKLFILLWPDFEYAEKEIEALGLTVIQAKNFLPQWGDDSGSVYRIHPLYETHPNALAATDLANGLARYFNELAARAGGTPQNKNQIQEPAVAN